MEAELAIKVEGCKLNLEVCPIPCSSLYGQPQISNTEAQSKLAGSPDGGADQPSLSGCLSAGGIPHFQVRLELSSGLPSVQNLKKALHNKMHSS